jgi:hypothetical protein
MRAIKTIRIKALGQGRLFVCNLFFARNWLFDLAFERLGPLRTLIREGRGAMLDTRSDTFDHTDDSQSHSDGTEEPCTTEFRLEDLKVGKPDKLGNNVVRILCLGKKYAIYRSSEGIYVHFSNCSNEENEQRKRFTEIVPELCELRYLTRVMFKLPGRRELFEKNMAQALMLVLEGNLEDGKRIAKQALQMAEQRATNDNTVKYVLFCLISGVAASAIGLLAMWFFNWWFSPAKWDSLYIVAGIFGAAGAVLSVTTRYQAFRLRPCNESIMTYCMSAVRVLVGVMSAVVLVMLTDRLFSDAFAAMIHNETGEWRDWESIALLGIVGGFAERLVPSLLQATANGFGTPVQAVRDAQSHEKAFKAMRS